MTTQLRFGKNPPKFNEKTLNFARYMAKGVLPFPEPPKLAREWKLPTKGWGMYGNDRTGDCTLASKAHQIMLFTAHTGVMVTPDQQAILDAYSAISGYDQTTCANDNGCAMTDVLEYWQTKGIDGHKILGWMQIDNRNIDRVKQAMYLFGAVDIGINVPASAMDQFSLSKAWDVVPNDGGIEGGHCIPLFGYGMIGDSCVTWGQRQEMTWSFFLKYCDEAYAVITEDWINRTTLLAPNGLNLAALQDDLRAIAA